MAVLRDRLAKEIDACRSNRDLAALTLRYESVVATIAEIDGQAPQVGSKADELAARRAERKAAGQ